MPIKATTGIAPEWWKYPDEDSEADTPTEFHLFPLSGPEMLEVQEHFDPDTSAIKGRGLFIACKYGLRGWRNVVDDTGTEVVFNAMTLKLLPAEVLARAGSRIVNISLVTPDAEKNLLSQSK